MTAWQYMFLPDYIDYFVQHTQVKSDSAWLPLTRERVVIFEPEPVEAWIAFVHPWIAFGSLLAIVVVISLWDWRRQNLSRWLDVLLFGVAGLIGVLLLMLWTLTDHHDAANNFNLLWALPSHLIGVYLLLKRHSFTARYFFFCVILLGSTLLFWSSRIQELNIFLLPVTCALLIRSTLIWRLTK
jgi:CDP-diglyceride synthetase